MIFWGASRHGYLKVIAIDPIFVLYICSMLFGAMKLNCKRYPNYNFRAEINTFRILRFFLFSTYQHFSKFCLRAWDVRSEDGKPCSPNSLHKFFT